MSNSCNLTFVYLHKEMRWTNQPIEDLPKYPSSPPPLLTGHETKMVFIFSLHWHSKWPERILPWCYFYAVSQLWTPLQIPTPDSLRKSQRESDFVSVMTPRKLRKTGWLFSSIKPQSNQTPWVSFLLFLLSGFLNLLSLQPNYTRLLLLFFDSILTSFLNAVMFSGLASRTVGE